MIGYVVLAFGYSLAFQGRDAFIDELYIIDEHRGQGLGTQAMHQIEAEAKGLDVRVLHLEVGRENSRAPTALCRTGIYAADPLCLDEQRFASQERVMHPIRFVLSVYKQNDLQLGSGKTMSLMLFGR